MPELHHLAKTFANNGHITQEERREYRDYHLGLSYLNWNTNNLITKILWANIRLPLGLFLCSDGQWRHISKIAKNGRKRP